MIDCKGPCTFLPTSWKGNTIKTQSNMCKKSSTCVCDLLVHVCTKKRVEVWLQEAKAWATHQRKEEIELGWKS